VNPESIYPIIVSGAFSIFLLTFLYAVLRWVLADATCRGKAGWPLAMLMVGAPIIAFAARIAFRSLVPRPLALGLMLGVPLVVWILWLFVRPAVRQESSAAILCGSDGAVSRWILILSLVASGYGVAVVWLAQFVMYPLYLSVPPADFLEYYSRYEVAIVFPVIVALSLTWTLAALLILYHPRPIPAWAPWSAAALALVGFVASQALESPYNQQLLEHGYSADAIHAKITFNWYRLTAWTLQAALLAWMTNLVLAAGDSKRMMAKEAPN
jgi:hypothetical protein